MATDEEKTRLGKLLKDLETPDVKLTERCYDLVKQFHVQFDKEVEEESQEILDFVMQDDLSDNPYRVEKGLLEETEAKLKRLVAEGRRAKKEYIESLKNDSADPKRPWRTNSSKEKLLRIDNEIKRHQEKAIEKITPLPDDDMKKLVKDCDEEGKDHDAPSSMTVRDVVDEAKRNLPNFQYRKIENSTAKAILSAAHLIEKDVQIVQFKAGTGGGDEVS